MKLFAVLLLILGINGQLQAAIEPVYEGSSGIRDNVLAVCLGCHSTTVSGAARKNAPPVVNFNTYADAFLWAPDMVQQVTLNAMPPAGTTPLTTEQRAALLAWQAAGFPEKATSVKDTEKPTTPAGLTATTISSNAISLAWTPSTDNSAVTSYLVFRGGTQVAKLGNLSTYRDTGVSASRSYSYAVQACDAALNCSALSATATAVTLSQPDCLLNWAETNFRDYFAPPTLSQTVSIYYVRFYPPGTYLAIASNSLLYLGPLSSGAVLNLGDVATWYSRSNCN